MQPGGAREEDFYSITFQVWRPSEDPPVNTCYSQVGNNTFNRITLGEGGLVCESPRVGEEIAVRPGDVVGFYGVHKKGGTRGIQFQK